MGRDVERERGRERERKVEEFEAGKKGRREAERGSKISTRKQDRGIKTEGGGRENKRQKEEAQSDGVAKEGGGISEREADRQSDRGGGRERSGEGGRFRGGRLQSECLEALTADRSAESKKMEITEIQPFSQTHCKTLFISQATTVSSTTLYTQLYKAHHTARTRLHIQLDINTLRNQQGPLITNNGIKGVIEALVNPL